MQIALCKKAVGRRILEYLTWAGNCPFLALTFLICKMKELVGMLSSEPFTLCLLCFWGLRVFRVCSGKSVFQTLIPMSFWRMVTGEPRGPPAMGRGAETQSVLELGGVGVMSTRVLLGLLVPLGLRQM